MLSCREYLERHSEYLDGCLDEETAKRWRNHTETCSVCRGYDRVVRKGLGLLDQLAVVTPSEDFLPRFRHRLMHHREERVVFRRRVAGGLAAASVAIAATLAAVAWGPWLKPSRSAVDLFPVEARQPLSPPPAFGLDAPRTQPSPVEFRSRSVFSEPRDPTPVSRSLGWRPPAGPRPAGLGISAPSTPTRYPLEERSLGPALEDVVDSVIQSTGRIPDRN